MKTIELCVVLLIMAFVMTAFSNGIVILDAQTGLFFPLVSNAITVDVQNQVAIVTTRNTFINNSGIDTKAKYAFPLPEGASATELKWKVNDQWYTAKVSPTAQDTTMPGPGGDMNPQLKTFLGSTPLFFDIEQVIQKDSSLVVEVVYVQLLSYEFGTVSFTYPNDYSLIQNGTLDSQDFLFTLSSARTIDNIELVQGLQLVSRANDGHTATIQCHQEDVRADKDYEINYVLNSAELGLYSLSTRIPDASLPDPFGGFFMFVAEPDASEGTDVIQKNFTLIIDCSSSMSYEGGVKIIQARDAASFIVENLNTGDKFNIVKFSYFGTTLWSAHQEFNIINEATALDFIKNIQASGSTNISDAFDKAVPQFTNTSANSANIIIFFTDGGATEGVTETSALAAFVKNLVKNTGKKICIFTFGIGQSINSQLLTLLATQNNGMAQFLGNSELQERISNFYLQIRKPVLLDTKISFSAPDISEVYPDPLPNLYKGQQLIVTGRYKNAGTVNVTFSGTTFGQPVAYNYPIALDSAELPQNQFLSKIWAKQKIENLLVQYFLMDPLTYEANIMKEQIIEFSVMYGVVSPFTSFYQPSTGVESEEKQMAATAPAAYELLGNYPNPFNASTKIRFVVHQDINTIVTIKIYNVLGQVVRVLTMNANGAGTYEVLWDGTTAGGVQAPSGTYIYTIDFGDGILCGKMQYVR
jgi:Ca-activated chloride channel homolog